MAIVTDKEIYLDDNLKDLVDLCIRRQQKKWDNVLIIDGDERSGKTTLAKSIAYYYSHTTGKEFSLKNIFFDPEEMLHFATDNKEEVLIWDEAAFGGLSTQWQNKIQQKLNSMLMVTGKYRDFYIFIIPSFFRLNRYLAIDRSIGLIHVYSPDMLTRGHFTCYSKAQKTWIYNNNRKSESYGKNISFRGKFTVKNTDKIVDEDEYEAKKDAAIKKYLTETKMNKADKLTKLQYTIATAMGAKEASERLGIGENTVYDWRNYGETLGLKPRNPIKS